MRGKPRYPALRELSRRITPAGAGKTTHSRLPIEQFRDHPRRCGENSFQAWLAANGLGSPPQVRGKLDSVQIRKFAHGITPAGAGKTAFQRRRRAAHEDHPRRCGENRVRLEEHLCGLGSPPQVRGKLRAGGKAQMPRRITPAGAGKTVRDFYRVPLNEDHPRRCGENYHSN